MKRIEATGMSTPAMCGVCGGPVKTRVVKDGEVAERGEMVWFQLWGNGPYMHLACCDERGRPLEAKKVSP